MKKKNLEYDNVIEGLKSNCRSYLVHKKDFKSVAFVFYSILSQSHKEDVSILNSFLNTFNDKNLELQKYINSYSDLRYCIALYLAYIYKTSSSETVENLLEIEQQIFDFLFTIGLSRKFEENTDSLSLLKILGLLGLTA